MARSKVTSRLMPDVNLPRNEFDRSHFINLNFPLGMILPVMAEFIPAGSKGRVNRSQLVRMNAVNTAAFPRLDIHMDFYMVPIKKLWSRWNNFYLNVNDEDSSALYPNLSSLGVPSTAPFCQSSDLMNSIFQTGGSRNDELGYPMLNGAQRLWDLLQYNDGNIAGRSYDMSLNTLRLQCYQYLYYKYYRNTAYESDNPFAYNCDYLYSRAESVGQYSQSEATLLNYVHYVNYRKDYFTNIFPALNYVVSNPSGNNWFLPSSVVGASGLFFGGASSSAAVSPSGTTQSVNLQFSTNGSNTIVGTVQQVRAAFALDKLLRASAYAPKRVKDQYKARFGIDVKENSSDYLGSKKMDVLISEVTSTASTDLDGLGAVGGRAVNFSSKDGDDIVFHNEGKTDCILMCLQYVMVRSVYDSLRVDSFNFKFSREDYFQPEFMDLGLRPITRLEMFMPNTGEGTVQNYILGYVPRGVEYKLAVDRNHGLFRVGSQLAVFTNHTNVAGRTNAAGSSGVTLAFFKTKPSDIDSIMVVAYDASSQLSDQFFGQIEFKLVVRQNMSVHGVPRL